MTRPDSSDLGERTDAAAALRRQAVGLVPGRTIALVGLMGAGKTTIGRRLAHALALPFVDADEAIVAAAGAALLSLLLYLIFRHSAAVLDRLGSIGTMVMTRLMAFILLCIGVQIIWTGWAELNGIKT